MDAVIGVHPGNTVAAPDSYTAWTGASGILDKLGIMMGGRIADPGTPGSGDTGSPTTGDARTSGVGPDQGGSGKMLLIAAAVVALVFLAKKL
jgi:hypothetical protein